MRLVLALLVAAAGCGTPGAGLFSFTLPEGLNCGADGSCPPNQVCVAYENRCRLPCTSPPGFVPCTETTSGNKPGCDCGLFPGPAVCDYDHVCRSYCNGMNAQTCNPCTGEGHVPEGSRCDDLGACRPPCVTDGGTTSGRCATFTGSNMGGGSMTCTLALPP